MMRAGSLAILFALAALPALAAGSSLTSNTYTSAAAVSAAGTSLATATPLTADINVFTTVGSGTGASIKPFAAPGVSRQEVINAGANALAVYPPTSSAAIWNLNGSTAAGAAGAAASLAVGSHGTFECVSATLCYLGP